VVGRRLLVWAEDDGVHVESSAVAEDRAQPVGVIRLGLGEQHEGRHVLGVVIAFAEVGGGFGVQVVEGALPVDHLGFELGERVVGVRGEDEPLTVEGAAVRVEPGWVGVGWQQPGQRSSRSEDHGPVDVGAEDGRGQGCGDHRPRGRLSAGAGEADACGSDLEQADFVALVVGANRGCGGGRGGHDAGQLAAFVVEVAAAGGGCAAQRVGRRRGLGLGGCSDRPGQPGPAALVKPRRGSRGGDGGGEADADPRAGGQGRARSVRRGLLGSLVVRPGRRLVGRMLAAVRWRPGRLRWLGARWLGARWLGAWRGARVRRFGRRFGGGRQGEHPADPDLVRVDQRVAIGLWPAAVEYVDFPPPVGVAEPRVGDVPQVVAPDHVVEAAGRLACPGRHPRVAVRVDVRRGSGHFRGGRVIGGLRGCGADSLRG
jgi:hypothetical protein